MNSAKWLNKLVLTSSVTVGSVMAWDSYRRSVNSDKNIRVLDELVKDNENKSRLLDAMKGKIEIREDKFTLSSNLTIRLLQKGLWGGRKERF